MIVIEGHEINPFNGYNNKEQVFRLILLLKEFGVTVKKFQIYVVVVESKIAMQTASQLQGHLDKGT
jgi:hypothetical protein